MKCAFDETIAKEIWVDEAIMYHNLQYRCDYHKANGKHFYDWHYRTYNSMDAFTDIFTFWTSKQIRRILRNLENKGYIKTWVYNKIWYDRTKWYTCIWPNGQMELPEQANGSDQTGEPIPNINTDENTDKNTELKTSTPRTTTTLFNSPNDLLDTLDTKLKQACIDFYNHREEIKKPMTDRAFILFIKKIKKIPLDIAEKEIERAIMNWRQSIYPKEDEPEPKNDQEHLELYLKIGHEKYRAKYWWSMAWKMKKETL